MKRLLSIVLFFACVMFSRGEVIDGINYLLDRVNYTASVKRGGTYIGSISIPSSVYYEGKKYTVNSIGEQAFLTCESLTSIYIPNSVTKIDKGAFWFCESLKSIEIPQSVTTIEEDSFFYCKNLQYVFIKNVSMIPSDAFYSCENLEFVEIPASVKFIASDAFRFCKRLKELRIPESCIIGDGGTLQNCDAKITRYSGSSNPQASTPQNNPQQGQQTIVVEHHRDPQPMQEWQQCVACYGSRQCPEYKCGGSGWYYVGDKARTCWRCHGSGKCDICAGQGGHYITVYR